MDKDRIAGSAKDFAGKVEGSVGDIAGDPKTQAASARRQAQRRTYTARPRMQRVKLRTPPPATPKTLMRTAAILSVTARKR
jgi:hypothetical protein